MKTIRLSLRIDEHDLDVKAKRAIRFLEANNSVKIVLMFKGRENAHEDLGRAKVNAFFEKVKGVAAIDSVPKKQGHSINMILIPSKSKSYETEK